jgi:hypothetical protein
LESLMKRNPWKLTSIVLAGLLGATLFAGTASAKRQPLMRDALHDLQVARGTLEAAAPDKGGHRVKAIELTDQAIAEVRQGMQFDNSH